MVEVVVRIDCLLAWFLDFFLKELFQTCLDTYRCKLRTFKVVISCREIGFCSILQSLHQIQQQCSQFYLNTRELVEKFEESVK